MTQKPPVLDATALERVVVIDYTNWKNIRSVRRILPIRWQFVTNNEYHPGPNWIIHAWDFERKDYREFAQSGIHKWTASEGTDHD